MRERLNELVRETMAKVLRMTAANITEQGSSPDITELRRTVLTTNWAAGYKAACDFLAERFGEQADNLEQPKEAAPEPAPQEFRKGDWVEHHELYYRIAWINSDGDGAKLAYGPGSGEGQQVTNLVPLLELKLIERCSTPTGPIRVGSVVSSLNRRNRGIVDEVNLRGDLTQEVVHVHWRDRCSSWHLRSELIHILSPEDR